MKRVSRSTVISAAPTEVWDPEVAIRYAIEGLPSRPGVMTNDLLAGLRAYIKTSGAK